MLCTSERAVSRQHQMNTIFYQKPYHGVMVAKFVALQRTARVRMPVTYADLRYSKLRIARFAKAP